MKRPAKPRPTEPPAPRLSGVRRLAYDDEDERPTREDLSYGTHIFNRGTVPLPRFLVPRRKRSH